MGKLVTPPRRDPDTRTPEEVLEARKHAVMGGCCNQFAEMSPCDCLERAERRARG